NMTVTKGFSESLLQIYTETIVKRLHVTKEMVDALGNSDITHLFHKLNKLNHELTAFAIDIGFSLKQIATIPFDQLSEYEAQFNDYYIPPDIQNQIANLLETNELNISGRELTTGQLCKILNELTVAHRNALTHLDLFYNQLTSLPDSFGNLSALTQLNLHVNQLTSLPDSFINLSALTRLLIAHNELTSLPDSFGDLSALTGLRLEENQLTSLPDSFGNLSALTELHLDNNNFDDNLKQAIQQRFNFAKI
ncbi:MAG: leucine-rich repeat domain-containing protein, partial [Candidatus Margulisiibacteriota bacterium]|nr:leucine-rich repeat domain-containing protein [Candidatus Margulisiibacteriota bacterium]